MSAKKALTLLKEAKKEIDKVSTTTDHGDYLSDNAKQYVNLAITCATDLASYTKS